MSSIPCRLGFVCPYEGVDSDGDPVCTHPYIPGYHNDNDPMMSIFDIAECPCIVGDSEMSQIMTDAEEREDFTTYDHKEF